MLVFLGVDDGNFDVKSSNTETTGGYTIHKKLPALTTEYLFYNDQFYVPDETRFDYLEDKMSNERCLILTLFGIAKQILYLVEKKTSSKEKQDIQAQISNIDQIVLGAGLPPLQWHLKDKKQDYYEKHMKNGIEFDYNGYHFSFKMVFCKLYPQGAAAIMTNANNPITQYPRYNAIDLGGGTMELIPFVKKAPNKPAVPDIPNCINENVGVNFMHQRIITDTKRNLGKTIAPIDVETVLRKRMCVLDDETQSYIREQAKKWTDEKIINRLIQSGCNFDTVPSIFLGGGSLLLKSFIKKNPLVNNVSFLPNASHANARGYEILVRDYYQKNFSK